MRIQLRQLLPMLHASRTPPRAADNASGVHRSEAPPPAYTAIPSSALGATAAVTLLVNRTLFRSSEDVPPWLMQRFERGFLVLHPRRRERFVTALGDMFEKRPPDEWKDLFDVLLMRCRLDDRSTWSRWLEAMRRLTTIDEQPPAWSAWSAALRSSPGLEDRLAHGAVFLSTDGWRVQDSLDLIVSAAPVGSDGEWLQFLDRLRVTTQPEQTLVQKRRVANALTRLPPEAWGTFGSVGQALCEGLPGTADTTPLFDMLSSVLAANEPAGSESITAATLRLCDRALDVERRVQILRAVNHVSAASRAEFLAVCLHMQQHDIEPEQIAANIQTIADTTADKRAQHCEDLLKGHEARSNSQVDPQNTSLYQRIDRTRVAIAHVQDLTKTLDTEKILTGLRAELKVMRQGRPPYELCALRGGAREIDNAWRTLCKPAKGRDLSAPLLDDPPYFVGDDVVHLGALAARVWKLVDDYTACESTPNEADRVRGNLRLSYFLALASCIEDDGWRVCNTGVAQRLLQVLQGYVPGICLDYVTPQTLLTELAAEYARDDSPGPTAFYAHACAEAANRYDSRSPEYRLFVSHLEQYVAMEFATPDVA